MARQLRPDLCQLNLGLLSEGSINLPLEKTAELHAALGDMLLNALSASETAVEADDESEAHS